MPVFAPFIRDGADAIKLAEDRHVLDFAEGSSPSNPDAGRWRLFLQSTGLFLRDDAGAETGPLADAAIGDFPRGMTIANNATDSDHDIDIAAGWRYSVDDDVAIELTSSITKQIDATWAVGTNAGGLDTGAVAADTTYHLWAIRRSDTGVVDVLFSTSVSSPTMPTNYDEKVLFASVVTDASSNILGFHQEGAWFYWDVFVEDYSSSNPGTSAVLRAIQVPTGRSVITNHVYGGVNAAAVGSEEYHLVSSPDSDDQTPTSSIYTAAANDADNRRAYTVVSLATNTSGQIRTRLSASTGSSFSVGHTYGWIDPLYFGVKV